MTISRLAKILGFAVVVGYLASLIASNYALQNLKVGGPIFNKIAQGKDLVADILPPPAYLIESYLEATLIIEDRHEAEIAKKDYPDFSQHALRLKSLQADYESRHEFWGKQDLPPELKETLLTTSFEPGKRFGSVCGAYGFHPMAAARQCSGVR